MLNWTRPGRRPISSRSTKSSTGNRISTISCKSRSRGGCSGGNIFPTSLLHWLEKDILPRYLLRCRWFGGKSQTIRSLRFSECLSMPEAQSLLAVIHLQYQEGPSENYFLPLSFMWTEKARRPAAALREGVICECPIDGRPAIILDGVYVPRFRRTLFRIIAHGEQIPCGKAWLRGVPSEKATPISVPAPRLLKAEQSNTAIIFGRRFYLKLFRKLEAGINPDVELTRYLGEQRKFPQVPLFNGMMELVPSQGEPVALGLLQTYVPNQTDAWTSATGEVRKYYERISARPGPGPAGLIGAAFLKKIRLLGQRTAEMHRALSHSAHPDFRPEALSATDLASMSRQMQGEARGVLRLLQERSPAFPPSIMKEAQAVLGFDSVIDRCFRSLKRIRPDFYRIRIHGDYHLGQVLMTKEDLVIIDFEGEPARTLGERRRKQCVLRDVAGMLRSFHYAACATGLKTKARRACYPAVGKWYSQVSEVFLTSYFGCLGNIGLLPSHRLDRQQLLDIYLLDKAIYELAYELDHRPDWVAVPLHGILDIAQKYSGRQIAALDVATAKKNGA